MDLEILLMGFILNRVFVRLIIEVIYTKDFCMFK